MTISQDFLKALYTELRKTVISTPTSITDGGALQFTFESNEGPVSCSLSQGELHIGSIAYRYSISASVGFLSVNGSINSFSAENGVPTMNAGAGMLSHSFALPENINEEYLTRILPLFEQMNAGVSPISQTEKIVTLTLEKI